MVNNIWLMCSLLGIGDYGDCEMSEWVKCSERLPKENVEVLIRISCNDHFNIENGRYEGCGLWIGAWCDTYGKKGSAYQVSHWMPLPEPPTD